MVEEVPAVDADPARLGSVLANLLSNAIRHTPAGGTVTVSAREAGDMVEIEVTDTGTGIPPDLLPNVFGRFVRGPGSEGSGLGLAIARDLVVAHGGSIIVESPPGRGTTFRFTLPR
jgi:two-component system sensor histidine kinase BaeS